MTCLRLACISSATAFAARTATACEAAHGMVGDELSQDPTGSAEGASRLSQCPGCALNR